MHRLAALLVAGVIGATSAWAQQAQPSSADMQTEIELLKKRLDALEKSQRAQPPAAPAAPAVLPPVTAPGGAPLPVTSAPPPPPQVQPAAVLPPVPTPGGALLPDVLDTALQRVPSTSEPLAPGWIVHVLVQPPSAREIPKREVGTFVWTSQAPTNLAAYRGHGIKFDGGPAYLLTGWLRIEQPGPYQLGLTIRSPSNELLIEDMRCSVAMQVGQQPLGEESTQLVLRKAATWTGEVDLKPGLYPISAEIRCPGVNGRLAADRAVIESYEIVTIAKRPGDQEARLLPAGLIVHPERR